MMYSFGAVYTKHKYKKLQIIKNIGINDRIDRIAIPAGSSSFFIKNIVAPTHNNVHTRKMIDKTLYLIIPHLTISSKIAGNSAFAV